VVFTQAIVIDFSSVTFFVKVCFVKIDTFKSEIMRVNMILNNDVQGFVNPPRVRGKGQKGKGQGKDFMTLNKPLTLIKGQGFFRGFISLISKYELSLNNVESEKISSKEASLPLQHLVLFRIH
jgi:hypothetical protein